MNVGGNVVWWRNLTIQHHEKGLTGRQTRSSWKVFHQTNTASSIWTARLWTQCVHLLCPAVVIHGNARGSHGPGRPCCRWWCIRRGAWHGGGSERRGDRPHGRLPHPAPSHVGDKRRRAHAPKHREPPLHQQAWHLPVGPSGPRLLRRRHCPLRCSANSRPPSPAEATSQATSSTGDRRSEARELSDVRRVYRLQQFHPRLKAVEVGPCLFVKYTRSSGKHNWSIEPAFQVESWKYVTVAEYEAEEVLAASTRTTLEDLSNFRPRNVFRRTEAS